MSTAHRPTNPSAILISTKWRFAKGNKSMPVLEEVHLMKEYHGDLHMDNIIVQRFGLNFNVKLLNLFHWQASKREKYAGWYNRGHKKIFYDAMVGKNITQNTLRILSISVVD